MKKYFILLVFSLIIFFTCQNVLSQSTKEYYFDHFDPWNWSCPDKHPGNFIYEKSLVEIYPTDGTAAYTMRDPFTLCQLSQTVDLKEFEIETKVFFEPTFNYQTAGIIIFQDIDNYIILAAAFRQQNDETAGKGVLFLTSTKEGSYNKVQEEMEKIENEKNTWFLKITRKENEWHAYYSLDGTTYKEIGTTKNISIATKLGVGLTAYDSLDNSKIVKENIKAKFDLFKITTPQ